MPLLFTGRGVQRRGAVPGGESVPAGEPVDVADVSQQPRGTGRPNAVQVLWDVKDASKAVVIELADERYARLVLQVDNPRETVTLVENALR